jgi:asparagine synthetase B (glutamine-hydrolysing)
MCGIAGIIRFDGNAVAEASLEAMARRIRHRGPDGKGYCTFGPAGLAHRRLSIIDLSGGGADAFFEVPGVQSPGGLPRVGPLVEAWIVESHRKGLHHGEPFADSSAIPTYFLSRVAAQHVKCVLSGDEGDENFAGYSSSASVLWQHRPPQGAAAPRPQPVFV